MNIADISRALVLAVPDGDVIPRAWWASIRHEDRPDTPAILVLSDIVSSFQPVAGPGGVLQYPTDAPAGYPVQRVAARYGLTREGVVSALKRLGAQGLVVASKSGYPVPVPAAIAEASGVRLACVAPSRAQSPRERTGSSIATAGDTGLKAASAARRDLLPGSDSDRGGGGAGIGRKAIREDEASLSGPSSAQVRDYSTGWRGGGQNAPTRAEREVCRSIKEAFERETGEVKVAGREDQSLSLVRGGVRADDVRGIVDDMRRGYSNVNYLTWNAFCRDGLRYHRNRSNPPAEADGPPAEEYRTAAQIALEGRH